MSYVPTKGPLPGTQYIPSNGTEGEAFFERFCRHCAKDRAMREGDDYDECDDDELCEIIAASFRGEAVEWREMDDGEVKCIAFVEHGKQPPIARCERTVDMFDEARKP